MVFKGVFNYYQLCLFFRGAQKLPVFLIRSGTEGRSLGKTNLIFKRQGLG
ncbi:hypothetical protein THIOSC15_90005 [uncultured Thiomicrorhabdus sp.]